MLRLRQLIQPKNLIKLSTRLQSENNNSNLSSSHIRIPDPYPTDKYPHRNSMQLGEYEKIPPADESEVITVKIRDRDGDDHVIKGKVKG